MTVYRNFRYEYKWTKKASSNTRWKVILKKIQRELYPSLQRTYTKRTLIKTNFERSDHWNSSKLGDDKTKGFLAIGGTLLYRLQDQT